MIYYIDAPTKGFSGVNHTEEIYAGFVAYAAWNGVRASDLLYWNYNAKVNADLGSVNQVVLNTIGQGREVVPNSCAYQPVPPSSGPP